MLRNLTALAISGPTTDGGRLAPFRWTESKLVDSQPHEGLPEKWDFGWVEMRP